MARRDGKGGLPMPSVVMPRWLDVWGLLAQLPVSRQLGLDRTMWVLLTGAVLLIAVVIVAIVDPWRGGT